ncbi:hypothetical protein PInf_005915 [Phytophthora infestans]|nr:hypothetical protein PInf_005915 [Phytophthora infestans]
MRVLHLVLAVAVAFVAINDGVSTAAKTALRKGEQVGVDVVAAEVVGVVAVAVVVQEDRKKSASTSTWAHEEEGEEYVDMPPGTYLGPLFGGPHGDDFTDADVVKSGQKVKSINIRASERVDAVMLTVVSPTGEENTLYHGGDGGDLRTPLDLGEGEYITVMEAHWGKHEGHTRIKYIKFTTNKGDSSKARSASFI